MSIQRQMFSLIAVHLCCEPGSVCLAVMCLGRNAGMKVCVYSPETIVVSHHKRFHLLAVSSTGVGSLQKQVILQSIRNLVLIICQSSASVMEK